MLRKFLTIKGSTVRAADGDVGNIREMLFDDAEWKVRYLVITAGSWLTGHDVLLSPEAVDQIDSQGDSLSVRLTMHQVQTAPSTLTDQPISRQYAEHLARHYQWDPHWLMPYAATGMITAGMPSPMPPAVRPIEPISESSPTGDPHLRSSSEVCGYQIHAQDSEFGKIVDYLIDDANWQIRYLILAPHRWLPGKKVLLAPNWIETISFEQKQVFVNLASAAIQAAPAFDDTVPVDRLYEQRLHDHYGLKAYWDAVETVKVDRTGDLPRQ